MSTKTMNQVITNYFKTQEDCTFGINIGGKEYDNKQSIAQSRFRRVRARLHTAPDVQHGRGATGGLHTADAEGNLPQATKSQLLQVVPPRSVHHRLERRDWLRTEVLVREGNSCVKE